jgi:hypothetical protein
MLHATSGSGDGAPANRRQLKSPPQTSDYAIHRDVKDGKDVIVCTVGKTWPSL